MKTKEEILNSYNTTSADGLPEMSADDLLNAMEAYKQQFVEGAFTAARLLKDGSSQPDYEFATLEDYLKSLEVAVPPKDDLGETLALVADSIVTNFLPDDSSVTGFEFDFNMQGVGYTAFYSKDKGGFWKMSGWKMQGK